VVQADTRPAHRTVTQMCPRTRPRTNRRTYNRQCNGRSTGRCTRRHIGRHTGRLAVLHHEQLHVRANGWSSVRLSLRANVSQHV